MRSNAVICVSRCHSRHDTHMLHESSQQLVETRSRQAVTDGTTSISSCCQPARKQSQTRIDQRQDSHGLSPEGSGCDPPLLLTPLLELFQAPGLLPKHVIHCRTSAKLCAAGETTIAQAAHLAGCRPTLAMHVAIMPGCFGLLPLTLLCLSVTASLTSR